jgi:lipopolysaccharide transport system permease protein
METIVLKRNASDRHYWFDLWRYRELFYVLAWRDVSVRYKQTVLGVLWVLIQPLVTLAVFTFVFGKVANLPSDGGVPYSIMVCAGLLPWQFFSTAFVNSSGSIVGNATLVTKVYFPRIIIPAASIVVAVVDFVIAIIIIAALLLYYKITPSLALFYLAPLCIIMACLFSLGAGLMMAALNVRYRDVRYIIPFIVQVGLYLSPVGFSVSLVPEQYRWAYYLNPMASVIDGFRSSIIPGAVFDVVGFATGWVVTFVFLFLGVRLFRRTEKSFADVI